MFFVISWLPMGGIDSIRIELYSVMGELGMVAREFELAFGFFVKWE
jgi:hypothetical protein